jgi:hypothetical protein
MSPRTLPMAAPVGPNTALKGAEAYTEMGDPTAYRGT